MTSNDDSLVSKIRNVPSAVRNTAMAIAGSILLSGCASATQLQSGKEPVRHGNKPSKKTVRVDDITVPERLVRRAAYAKDDLDRTNYMNEDFDPETYASKHAKLFRKMDTDGDNRISQGELDEYVQKYSP